MPELPEVETTVGGLKKVLPGLKITDVWTDLAVKKPTRKDYYKTIKSSDFFSFFKKEVVGKKVERVERRAKNILIYLSNNRVILIHLKMTGHLLYGKYKKVKKMWLPDEVGPLQDPFNRFIHVVFSLSNKKHLAFCDARKFGKVTLLETSQIKKLKLGPEPLDKSFQFSDFKKQLLKKPKGKIKTVLMNQELISGIGNIYSDEILWLSGVHPETATRNIPEGILKRIFSSMKILLEKGIHFGGDSTSDYRNILGEKGHFQHHHNVYRRKNEKCAKIGCKGIIKRKIIDGRSSHFCPIHQKLKWPV